MRSLLPPLVCLLTIFTYPIALGSGPSRSIEPPQLIFESTDTSQGLVNRLRQVKPKSFQGAMKLFGLRNPGSPIRVVLATENSPLAKRVPSWVLGYAAGKAGIIVLLTDRVPSYPYGSLEEVLSHEVAHILLARAAQGRPVPRWFDEGLAMIVAERWNLEDRARLVWAMVGGKQVSLKEVNSLFRQDEASARRAYVLSAAFARELIRRWGPTAVPRMLELVARDVSFAEAFLRITSFSLAQAEASFWARQNMWNRWMPILTSTATLWLGITLLVFYAYRQRKKRALAIRQEWAEEDAEM